VTVDRDLHPEKQQLETFATEDRIQIDEREEQPQNAPRSIRDSFEPDSKVTVERDLHRLNHSAQSVATDEGMQIGKRQEHPANAESARTSAEPLSRKVSPTKECKLRIEMNIREISDHQSRQVSSRI
jgi:hypothetical protein